MSGRRAARARPHARTSQHFLRSRTLAAELVRDAGVLASDHVVEIGAGTGLITRELARCAGHVDAIELSPDLAARLRGRFARDAHVRVVEADALAVPLPDHDFTVVANLPFHLTSAALRHLLDDPRLRLRRADLVVAWGAALKRARVWPSTALGVCWGAWFTFALRRRLPAAAFAPQPRVDAAVLVIERREAPLVAVSEWHAFRAFVRAGFRAGRLIGHGRSFRRAADVYGFARTAGARDLDVYQWAGLYRTSRSTSDRPAMLSRDHEPFNPVP